MSEELSTMIRAAARSGATQPPMPPGETAMFVGRVARRRIARGALMTGVGLAATLAIVFGAIHLWPATQGGPGAIPLPSQSLQVSLSPTPSVSTGSSPSPTLTPSVSAPSPNTTAPTPPPETTVPAAVSNLTAGSGGGSGEIVLHWRGTPDATGYRVYRTSAPGDSMTRSASYVIATGSTTVQYGGSYEFIQIWSPSSNAFEYVESVDGQPGYFVVAAFNSAGEDPLQGTVCAVPMASSVTC